MLSIVLLWIVIYLSGSFICKIGGEKETSQLWKQLIGFFFLFFCQGCVFFVGQLMGYSFSKSRGILVGILTGITLLSFVVCYRELVKIVIKIKDFSLKKMKYGRYKALVLWLFLGFIMVITMKTVGNRNDAMVETVQTTLMTDTMNQYHPFTKQPLELGMILSKKIITLPFWYASLSVWTGINAVDTVWSLGSLLTVFFSLMAFGELAGLLFLRDFKKSWLLIVLLELMYLSGDYYIGSAGYRQLFYGYSGDVIAATIIIPGVFCILYRFLGPHMWNEFPKEEKLSLWGFLVEFGICVGSSLFLTSFAWGIVLVIITVILFFLSLAGRKFIKKMKKAEVDEAWVK